MASHYFGLHVDRSDFYSQRNNKIDPLIACQVTAMIQAADLAGWAHKFPKNSTYSQPEDALRARIIAEKKNPEDHLVLSEYTNKFLSAKEATHFQTETAIAAILQDLQNHLPVTVSGTFPYTNVKGEHVQMGHIFNLIGFDFNDETGSVNQFHLLDSYGDYHTNFRESGFDVKMPYSEFIYYVKNCKGTTKWTHRWVHA